MNVIELLNQARGRELTALTQYMAQHYQLEDQGYGKLAARVKEIAIVEMRHAEAFAERILFLGGVPITKPDAGVAQQQEMADMMGTDIGLEQGAIDMYNKSAEECGQQGDHVSRALFTKIAEQEEEHLNDFQNFADHIAKLGQAYIATLTD